MTVSSVLVFGGGFAVQTASASDPTVEADAICNDGQPVLALENDVEDSSTVTISPDDGGEDTTVTLNADEKQDVELEAGTYTITATSLGNPMRVNDQDSVTLDLSCGDPAQEPAEGQTVGAETGPCEIGLENNYGEEVTVFIEAHQESDTQESMTLPVGGGSDVPADAGTYTLTAETSDGNTDVPVNNQDEVTVTVECSGTGEPQTVLADGGCEEISLENAYGETVEITIDGPDGTNTVTLEHLGDIGYPTAVGEYTVTAQTTDGDPVPVNEGNQATILVVECPTESVNIDARSYDCDTLEVENENKEVEVEVSVYDESGALFDTITLGPDERQRVDGYAEGATYTLEAEADGRSVTVNGADSDEITMEAC